jgi:hypothetical protein
MRKPTYLRYRRVLKVTKEILVIILLILAITIKILSI